LTHVEVALSEVDGDAGRLELATAALRRELLDLDVADVVAGSVQEAPPNTRAVDVVTIGNLVVTLGQTSDALRQLATTVHQWIGRDGGRRTAELTIDGDTLTVTGIDAQTQNRLIDAWLRAHRHG
jgi:hypothetical protein